MSDELKKVAPPVSADHADSTPQDQISKEDVERAKLYLEQQYFVCELSVEYADTTAILRDDKGEIVAWIAADGTVFALCDEGFISFHISEISEEEDEMSEEDWLSFWFDQFDESETDEYSWTPTTVQHDATKFSDSGQTYTQYLAPCAKVSDFLDLEDTSGAPVQAIDDLQVGIDEVAKEIFDGNNSTMAVSAEIALTDSEFALPDYEGSELEATIPRADASDVLSRSKESVKSTSQQKSTDGSAASKSNDSAHGTPDADVSKEFVANAALATDESGSEEVGELSYEHTSESTAMSASSRSAKSDPETHDATRELSSDALPKHIEPSDVARTKPFARVAASSDVIITAAKDNSAGPTRSHSTGAWALVSDSDPFAVACAQAGKGGLPDLSHASTPVALASLHDSSSRESVEPARHSDGHNERQGHDRDSDDRGNQGEYGSSDDAEEEFC